MALELVDCTHCHYKFRMDIGEREEEGDTTVVRGILDFLKPKPRRIKTIDIECPNCKRTFEYEIKS